MSLVESAPKACGVTESQPQNTKSRDIVVAGRQAMLWPSGVLRRSLSFKRAIFEIKDLFRLVRSYLEPGVLFCKTAVLCNNGTDYRMRALRVSLRQARADLSRTQHFFNHVAVRVYLGTTSYHHCTEQLSLRGCKAVLEQYSYTHHVDDDGMLHVDSPQTAKKARI